MSTVTVIGGESTVEDPGGSSSSPAPAAELSREHCRVEPGDVLGDVHHRDVLAVAVDWEDRALQEVAAAGV